MQADQECKFVIWIKTSTMMDQPTDHTGRFDSCFPHISKFFFWKTYEGTPRIGLGGKISHKLCLFREYFHFYPPVLIFKKNWFSRTILHQILVDFSPQNRFSFRSIWWEILVLLQNDHWNSHLEEIMSWWQKVKK